MFEERLITGISPKVKNNIHNFQIKNLSISQKFTIPLTQAATNTFPYGSFLFILLGSKYYKTAEDQYMYPTQVFNEVALTLYRKLPSVTNYSSILQYFLLCPSLRKYYDILHQTLQNDWFFPQTLYLSASCIKCPLFSDCAICQLLVINNYNRRYREAANCFHTRVLQVIRYFMMSLTPFNFRCLFHR